MIYKIGERTLTLQGVITGELYADQRIIYPSHFYFGWGELAAQGIFGQVYTHDSDIGYGSWHHQLTVVAGTGLTNASVVTDAKSGSYTYAPFSTKTVDCSGNYTITADLEQWAEILYDTWNGYEAPQRTTVRFYETLKAGGYITTTATSGTCSA